jgi:selenocysteine lyase/cysteine desulfurase
MAVDAFDELLQRGFTALETYSNVNRGTGQFSNVTTRLYEHARHQVLLYARLSPRRYEAVFCNQTQRERLLCAYRQHVVFQIDAADIGLQLGVGALVFRKHILPRLKPVATGGGMVELVNRSFAVFARGADRFEVGTPPIMNAILLGIALQMLRESNDPTLFTSRKSHPDPAAILSNKEWPGLSGETLLTALRQTHIGRQVPVPTTAGNKHYINFDGAASTPSFAPVWQTFCEVLRLPPEQQQTMVAHAAVILRGFFDAPPDQYDLCFTTNTSEAIHLALQALKQACEANDCQPVILNTLMEHHSNELPWRYEPSFTLAQTPIDRDGFIDLPALETNLRAYNHDHSHGDQRIVLVTVNGASNVLGSLNPLEEIAALAHRFGARLLVDGAQLSAHRAFSLQQSGVDFYTFSAHKIYAPFGSGGLLLPAGMLTAKQAAPYHTIANAAGIAALAKAVSLLQRIGMDVIEAYERELTRRALAVLASFDRLRVYGINHPDDARFIDKAPVIAFEMRGMPHNLLAKYLADLGAIGTRNGCFCTHMLVIDLMGIAAWRSRLAKWVLDLGGDWLLPILPGLVRVSFGIENDLQEIDQLRQTLLEINGRNPGLFNRWLASVHEGTFYLPRSGAENDIERFVQERIGMVFP